MKLALLALVLVSMCMILQSGGTILLIHWLARRRHLLESRLARRRMGLLLRIFLWIVVIHLVQVSVWALGFRWTGQLPDLETASYFSLVTFTTIGFGDVVLPPGWRLLAGVEGLTGIMLIGWSTALMFTVVNLMYEHWRREHEV
jgi:voltage-gated potassium channel